MGFEDITLKDKTKAYIIALVVGSGGFYTGYLTSIFNPIGTPLLRDDYKLDKKEIAYALGNINLFFSLGGLVSVLGFGYLFDILGRKKSLILSEIMTVGASLCYCIKFIPCLYLARFISGLSAGVNVSGASVLLGELLPKSVSGFGGIFIYTSITFAILVSYLQQTFFSQEFMGKHWRIFLIWPLILSFIRIILLLKFVPMETPQFYLARITNNDQILKETLINVLSPLYESSQIEEEVDKLIAENKVDKKETSFLQLFSSRYLYRTIGGCLINLSEQFCGVNFLVFFSTDLFNEISNNGEFMTTVLGVANFFGSFIAIYAVQKFGRRFNIVTGVLVQLLSFSLLSWAIFYNNKILPAFCVTLYMLGFAMGIGPTIIPYCADILPPMGVGFAKAFQWIGSSTVAKVSPILEQK